MKLTEILYEDVKDIWDGYLKHPFVSGIGDGSLSIERFRFYMLQDYLYLYDYARVYALGIVKSREPEMMQFFSQALLKAGVSFAIIIKCLEIVCYETFDEWLSAAKK